MLLYQPFLEVSVGRVSKKIFLTLPEHVAPLSIKPISISFIPRPTGRLSLYPGARHRQGRIHCNNPVSYPYHPMMVMGGHSICRLKYSRAVGLVAVAAQFSPQSP